MTRENSDHDKDNPATNPERENGQGKHDGASHKPDEFDVMNPCANERRTRTRNQALSGPEGNQACGNNPMRLHFG